MTTEQELREAFLSLRAPLVNTWDELGVTLSYPAATAYKHLPAVSVTANLHFGPESRFALHIIVDERPACSSYAINYYQGERVSRLIMFVTLSEVMSVWKQLADLAPEISETYPLPLQEALALFTRHEEK